MNDVRNCIRAMWTDHVPTCVTVSSIDAV